MVNLENLYHLGSKTGNFEKKLSRYSCMSSSDERSILVLFICLIHNNLQNEWVNARSGLHFIIKSSFICQRRRRGACFTLYWLAGLFILVHFFCVYSCPCYSFLFSMDKLMQLFIEYLFKDLNASKLIINEIRWSREVSICLFIFNYC